MTFQNQAFSGINAISFVGKRKTTFLISQTMQSFESQISFHVMTLFCFLNFHNIVICQVKRKYLQWQPASILLNTPMYSFSTWKNLLSPSVHQAFSSLVYDLGPDGTDICIGKSLYSPHREH